MPPPELKQYDRPIRSDYGQEKTYARRRLATLFVVAMAIIGTSYAMWGRGPPNPADIPTVNAEAPYKQKPDAPGGIDIPHQDVQVYDEIEGRTTPGASVEHLLPPPEVPHVAAVPPPAAPPAVAVIAPAPAPAPRESVSSAKENTDAILNPPPAPPMATTVSPPSVAPIAPAPTAATIKPAPQTLTIDQVIKNTQASAVAPSPPAIAAASGSTVIQLASSNDKAKANAMMQELQQKYAAKLGGASLRLVRADLAKGVFYRIQSQGMSADAAGRICASMKQANQGCILVGR